MNGAKTDFFEKSRSIQKIHLVMQVEDGRAQIKAPQKPHPKRLWHGLMFQICGQTCYYYGDEAFVVNAGDVMYFPQGYEYNSQVLDGPNACICINFEIYEEGSFFPEVYRDVETEKQRILFENLKIQWEKGENEFSCMKILYEIMEHLYTTQRGNCVSSKKKERFREARDYIAEHYTEPALSPGVVANAVGISPIYLRKLFSIFSTMSPQEYIISCRIRYAKGLLKTETLSIAIIAQMAGFADAGYFCRKFKAVTGMTPAEYRATGIWAEPDVAHL